MAVNSNDQSVGNGSADDVLWGNAVRGTVDQGCERFVVASGDHDLRVDGIDVSRGSKIASGLSDAGLVGADIDGRPANSSFGIAKTAGLRFGGTKDGMRRLSRFGIFWSLRIPVVAASSTFEEASVGHRSGHRRWLRVKRQSRHRRWRQPRMTSARAQLSLAS